MSGFVMSVLASGDVKEGKVEDGFGRGGSLSEDCDPWTCFFWGLVATMGKLRAVLQIPEPFGFRGRSTLLCSGPSGSGSFGNSSTFLGLPLLPGTSNCYFKQRVEQSAKLTLFWSFGYLYRVLC